MSPDFHPRKFHPMPEREKDGGYFVPLTSSTSVRGSIEGELALFHP
jgi:hypothetical protein